jgi:hypothetical protein
VRRGDRCPQQHAAVSVPGPEADKAGARRDHTRGTLAAQRIAELLQQRLEQRHCHVAIAIGQNAGQVVRADLEQTGSGVRPAPEVPLRLAYQGIRVARPRMGDAAWPGHIAEVDCDKQPARARVALSQPVECRKQSAPLPSGGNSDGGHQ